MRYGTYTNSNGMVEIVVSEGTAYVVFSKSCNTGIDIASVSEGDTFYEGVGEEIKGVFDSYDEAVNFTNRTFFRG